MEEFITVMSGNLDKDMIHKKSLTNREVLNTMLNLSSPVITKIHQGKEKGDLFFLIPVSNLGINPIFFSKYQYELFSPFIINFMGEFLIRENISMFAKVLTELKSEDYISIVNSYRHKRFGMEIRDNNIIFYFHASLIQRILTEDIREKI